MMELDKHIAVFDNVLSQPECQDIIDYWEWMDAKQLSHTRRQLRDSSASNKSDTTVFPLEPSMRLGPDQAAFDLFLQRYWVTQVNCNISNRFHPILLQLYGLHLTIIIYTKHIGKQI